MDGLAQNDKMSPSEAFFPRDLNQGRGKSHAFRRENRREGDPEEEEPKGRQSYGTRESQNRWEGIARLCHKASSLGKHQGPRFSELLSSSPPIVMTILALLLGNKHPKTQWPETRFIYFAYEFAIWAKLGWDCLYLFHDAQGSTWMTGARS